jgi:hypothetical protein
MAETGKTLLCQDVQVSFIVEKDDLVVVRADFGGSDRLPYRAEYSTVHGDARHFMNERDAREVAKFSKGRVIRMTKTTIVTAIGEVLE